MMSKSKISSFFSKLMLAFLAFPIIWSALALMLGIAVLYSEVLGPPKNSEELFLYSKDGIKIGTSSARVVSLDTNSDTLPDHFASNGCIFLSYQPSMTGIATESCSVSNSDLEVMTKHPGEIGELAASELLNRKGFIIKTTTLGTTESLQSSSLYRSPNSDTLLIQRDSNLNLRTFSFSATEVREIPPPLWVKIKIQLGDPSPLIFFLFLTPPMLFTSLFAQLFPTGSMGVYAIFSSLVSLASFVLWIYFFIMEMRKFLPKKRNLQ